MGELISICDIDNINEKIQKEQSKRLLLLSCHKGYFSIKKKETALLNRMYVHEEEEDLVGEKSIACISITGI